MRFRNKNLALYSIFKRKRTDSNYIGSDIVYEQAGEITGELYSAQTARGVNEFGERASKMAYFLSKDLLEIGDGIGLPGSESPLYCITGIASFSAWTQYTLEVVS